MAEETAVVTFSFREIAETLIKKLDLHEGNWGLYVEFGLGAGNFPGPSGKPNDLVPGALVPITKVGLQKFAVPNSLSVDAAEVNPVKQVGSGKK